MRELKIDDIMVSNPMDKAAIITRDNDGTELYRTVWIDGKMTHVLSVAGKVKLDRGRFYR